MQHRIEVDYPNQYIACRAASIEILARKEITFVFLRVSVGILFYVSKLPSR